MSVREYVTSASVTRMSRVRFASARERSVCMRRTAHALSRVIIEGCTCTRASPRPPRVLIYMTLTVVGERQPQKTWARTPFERRVGRVILSLWRTPTSCGSAPKPSDRWYKAPSRRRSCRSRPMAEKDRFLSDPSAVCNSLHCNRPGGQSGASGTD